ncbi:hypothetical protein GM708_10195 [Vibrio cholerae]|nr:hypothetical protein [Vibrio cholerae]
MIGAGLVVSLMMSALWALLAVFWQDQKLNLLTVAACVPVFVLADLVRYYLIGTRRDMRLLVFDVVYVCANVIVIYLSADITNQPDKTFWWWAATAFFVTTIGIVWCGCFPTFKRSAGWARDHWSSGSAFTVEATLGAALGYLIVLILAIFSTEQDVAAFRTAVAIFGLSSLVINFLRTTVLREFSSSSLSGTVEGQVGKMLLLTLIAVSFSYVLLTSLPENIGRGLFGETWVFVAPLFLVAAVNRFAASMSTIPSVLLRALGVSWRVTRLRMWVALVSLGLGPVGAYYAGAAGAFVAEAVAYAILTFALVVVYKDEVTKRA